MSDQTMTEDRNTRRGRRGRNSLAWVIVLLALAAPASAQTYTLAPTPFQTAFDNSGHVINNACVWTYTAGTTTAVFTYLDNAGTQNSNPIRSDSAGRFTAYLIAGSSYKFVYESSCTPPAHGTTLRTADNIGGVPSSASTVDINPATAGETISAGQCAYLSDGSGAKLAGQWYKCDSANTYSSTTAEVGIAIASISSGATGTVRISGSVTGLSSLSVGSEYFVGTAGAVTSTAPTLRRHLGHADSATSLVLTGDPQPPVYTIPIANDFRLTLTTATPVTTADVTAATTLFWTPILANRITLADGSGNLETCSATEKSIAVPATTSTMYDVWVFDSTFGTCTATLEVLAWTNDTTRATAITRTTTAFYTKSGDLTRRYVGSFRTTTVSGQTEDSVSNRFVWNYYNRAERPMQRFESTANWNYSTNTIRQANGSVLNQLNFIIGVSEDPVESSINVPFTQVTSTANILVCHGLDSTTTCAGNQQVSIVEWPGGGGSSSWTWARYRGFPGVGKHSLMWLEDTQGTGTTTWYGSGTTFAAQTTAASFFSGLLGSLKG